MIGTCRPAAHDPNYNNPKGDASWDKKRNEWRSETVRDVIVVVPALPTPHRLR